MVLKEIVSNGGKFIFGRKHESPHPKANRGYHILPYTELHYGIGSIEIIIMNQEVITLFQP